MDDSVKSLETVDRSSRQVRSSSRTKYILPKNAVMLLPEMNQIWFY